MGRVLIVLKSIAQRLESSSFVLVICLLIGLVIGGGILFVLDGWQFVGEYFSLAMSRLAEIAQTKVIVAWASGIIAGLAGLILLFSIIKHVGEKEDDPLFSPKITLLFLIVLIRVLWEIPNVHRTFQLALRDASGICQIVLIIMTIGLGAVYFQFLSLRREHLDFLEIRNRVERLSGIQKRDLDQSMAIMDGANGLLKSKWKNIKAVLKERLSSDYETLISFPDQAELLKESKISFIIKILPILGMIGTVLGFTIAVVGMQSAAANMNDFSSFKGNLMDALGGMKSAFLTTLVGMVSMVLVMWVNALIDESRRRILLQEAEFLYLEFFLPGQKLEHTKEEIPKTAESSMR